MRSSPAPIRSLPLPPRPSPIAARVPVFVDIDPATANLDARLHRASRHAAHSRHHAGSPLWPARGYGRDPRVLPRATMFAILEDAAQAHARALPRPARREPRAHAGAFSFYPTKNLGACGEGGALTTDDDQIASFARAARSHGQTARYEHEFVGFNYRMEGYQGAVLRIKLRRLYALDRPAPGNRAGVPPPAGGHAAGDARGRPARRMRVSPVCDLREQPERGDRAATPTAKSKPPCIIPGPCTCSQQRPERNQ